MLTLPGVGHKLAQTLARLGIQRIADLWFHLPLRYEDRSRLWPIAGLRPGQRAQIEGRIQAVEQSQRGRRQLRVRIADASAELELRFFHYATAQLRVLKPGLRLRCYGELRASLAGLEMVHPQYQVLPEDVELPLDAALTPVYPVVEGLGQARLRALVLRALELLDGERVELLPAALLARQGLPDLALALRQVHRPAPDSDLAALLEGRHPAQRRLAFEELLAHQLSMRLLRRQIRRHSAPVLDGDGRLRARLKAALPFELTAAQQRVLAELEADLARAKPMLRLVQGDVGSGKTVVAALAALAAAESGWQTAVMAPTELLAEQHLRNFRSWLEPLGLEVAWLSGKVQGRARLRALESIAQGAAVVVGTHALMQQGVAFARLGLVIIDEQHRFGVHQRLALRDKGASGALLPHQLVMTATPIPRTLAMTSYADLDLSVIDALPPGRSPVQTVVLSASRREALMQRIEAACAEGRQAYWVCTLVEASEQLEAEAAEETARALAERLPRLRVGLVHGRMRPAAKQHVMAAFAAARIDLLVATTVIEVGVDVPNASLMVIDNAERLGLSQLHQLRGRVGRGAVQSVCVLVYRPPLSPMARERLEVMRASHDGFVIAEKDLELRGPGELLGTRQTGQAQFRIADLGRDAGMIEHLGAVADELLATDPAAAAALVRRWIGQATRYAEA